MYYINIDLAIAYVSHKCTMQFRLCVNVSRFKGKFSVPYIDVVHFDKRYAAFSQPYNHISHENKRRVTLDCAYCFF